jgi:hypothetical protein
MTATELLANNWERRQCWEVVKRGGHYYDGPAPRAIIKTAIAILRERQQQRRDREIANQQPTPGRIVAEARERQAKREREARHRWEKRVAGVKLGLTRVRREFRKPEFQQRFLNKVGVTANGAVELIARAVGTIGDQAQRDLRELRTSTEFTGKQGKHHKFEETTIDLLQIRRDWSAALVTMRDYKSFGRAGFDGYEKRGGSSYRVYLIVRDTTTGEAHILRVPPKYGNGNTQFFQKFYYDARPRCRSMAGAERTAEEARIHAAVAWTFGLKPEEYQPQVEA